MKRAPVAPTQQYRAAEATALACPVCGRLAYPPGDRIPERGRLRTYCRPTCRDKAKAGRAA